MTITVDTIMPTHLLLGRQPFRHGDGSCDYFFLAMNPIATAATEAKSDKIAKKTTRETE